MAYYAYTDAVRHASSADEQTMRNIAEATAHNLRSYFPGLPDTGVVAALVGITNPDDLITDGVPILARSVRELARLTEDQGTIGQWRRRLDPSAVWTAQWDLTGAAIPWLVDDR